ncbi:hypothetical protein ABPG74_007168 [Tetrahymena malaccensis]
MEKIKETLDTFKQFIYNYFKESQQNTKQQIEQTLNLLAEYISEIEEQDYDQFGYYRYFIAFQSLKYLDMNQKEKECFEQIIEQFQQYVLQKIEKIKSELSEIRSKLPNDSASVSECLNRLLYEIQLIKDEDVKNQYLQGVFEITKDKIKAIFEKIIQLCKENNYHDENVKKQIQSNLEQLEYDIENIKEEKCQYGYYRYLIAFFRYKYISKDNKYSDEKKNYLKFILQNIQELENKLNELTSQQPVNEKQIEQHLENIQNEIKYIEKEDYIVFCYYKYLIASNKIKYNLNPNQKENYEKQLNDYKNLYEKCKYQRQQNNNQDENLNSSNNILSTITKGCRNISRNMSEQEKQRHQRIQQSFSNIDSTEIKQQSQMFNRQSQDSIDGNDFSFSKVFENRSDRQSQQLISNLKIKQPIQEDKIMESFSINSNNSLDSFCSLQLSKNDQEQINQNQNKKNNQLINQIQKPESIVQSKNLQNDQDKAVKLIQQLTQPQKEMLDQNKREKSFILKEEINQKVKTEGQDKKDNSDYFIPKAYLIIGETGVGKSSFIQYLTNDSRAEIGHGQNSLTSECRVFFKNEMKFIDSPGINDTQFNRYQILLRIVTYLKNQDLQLEDLFFICISNRQIQNHLNYLQEFAYIFFLYELFGNSITYIDIENLVNEYFQSSGLLNWQQTGLHFLEDDLSMRRHQVFQNKDDALNKIQRIQNLHIVVKTCFDQKNRESLRVFDDYQTEFLRQQIWSNIREKHIEMEAYREYISNQEQHLFKKITKIIDMWNEVQVWQRGDQIQNLVLIGESQIGKSSLIEQLKQISGIRGSGNQSYTSFCQIYLVEFNQVKYFFIDTPGFRGTEANQNPYHNLKITADFLRRNKITEFKILYMHHALEARNEMPQILKQLYNFIDQIFDQDSSLIDSECLNQMFPINNLEHQNDMLQNHQLQLIQSKILTIERVEQTTMNKGTIYKNRFGNNSVEFLSNHFTEQRILIKVNRDEDLIQKRTLFEGVNQIQPFCVDEKILIKIKQMSQYQIINSLTEYSKTYNELKKLYQQYYKILVRMNQRQQNQQNNYHNNLKDEKLRILTELQNRKIFVIGDFHNTQEMQDYIQREIPVQAGNNNQQNPQNERNRMIQNSLQKHFLKINFQPILFETNLNSKNIFLSRKQLYYSKYSHQLSPFFNKNEQKHRQILENLSVIKILQELATCFHIQYKKLELSYNQNPKDIIVWIEAFIQGINLTFGTGAHIYRSATYFSNIAEKALQVQKFSKGFSVATLWVNCVLAALSIGLDAYTYSKGYVCGRQIIFNSTFNLISGVLSIITFSATGLGLVFGAGAGLIAFIGYGISALLFTSSETYDQTLGLILKRIMDDQLPNQNLQYFQKSQFLKELNINNYYELQSKKAYELYRNIDKENYQQNEQNQYLLRLMNSNYPQRLQDQISYYITKNLISNLFLFETEYAQNQNIKDYLENITKQINYNQKIIDTFYNRFDQQNLLQKIKENKQRVDNNVKERTQHQNIDLQNDQIFKDSLLAYKESLNQFIQHIKQIEYSYQQYKEFGNGVVRKNDRFPITFNGYCNLVHEKSKQIFKQDTIRQINKNNNYFVINPENDFNNNFFQFTDSEWIFYLNLLISTDQFITNRYLLKYKGQNEFTFSYMSIEEMIDVDVKVQVEKFVDLYEIAKPLNGFDEFIANIKRQIDTELRFNEEMLMRLKKFYNSIGQLKETFR